MSIIIQLEIGDRKISDTQKLTNSFCQIKLFHRSNLTFLIKGFTYKIELVTNLFK